MSAGPIAEGMAAPSQIVFTDYSGDEPQIAVMSPDGSGRRQVTTRGGYAPAWSPNRSKIAFVRGGDIFIIDANGTNEVRLMRDRLTDNDPTWSPDGTKIAYSRRGADGKLDVYVRNSDGTQVATALTSSPGNEFDPDWSPDGTQIAYTRSGDGTLTFWAGIAVMSATGGEGTTRYKHSNGLGDPAFSPDGMQLAYWRMSPGFSVMVDNETLVSASRSITSPAWSPNGTRVAYQTYQGESESVIAIAGSVVAAKAGQPDWATSGEYVPPPVDPLPPDARFDVQGAGGQVIQFNGTASSDPDGGEIESYEWDFGDGSPKGHGATTSHTYTEAGEFVVVLTVTDDEGETNIYQERVVAFEMLAYAPTLKFHSAEQHWPMDPADFVASSELMWHHDGACSDKTITRRPSASKLGSGAYRARESDAATVRCDRYGPEYKSNQFTRPHTDPSESSKVNTEKQEGFYLDLADDRRGGQVGPSSGTYNGPTMYYDYVPHKYVVYWFFYGFNDPYRPGGSFVDDHEGEWERLAVRLNSDGEATDVAWYSHYCDPDDTPGLSYTFQEAKNKGYIENDTHPIAYVSRGSHASYPTAGEHSPGCEASKWAPGWFTDEMDVTEDGGAVWRPWASGKLAQIDVQPWYGFGGAWGDVGCRQDGVQGCTEWGPDLASLKTGPLGPPHKDPIELLNGW